MKYALCFPAREIVRGLFDEARRVLHGIRDAAGAE